MAKVRVILTQKVKHPVGSKLKIYGHDFIVQKDGTAAAMVEESVSGAEIKRGRYILADQAPKQIPVLNTSYVDSFGYDVGQYYGAGSLEKLKKKIDDMRKGEISHFAQTRLGENIRMNQSKSRMIFELIDAIKKQLESELPEAAETKEDPTDHEAEPADAPEDNADSMRFTFVDSEEKTEGSDKKASQSIKEKSRDELMAELDELEQLANQRKIKIESEK